MLLDTIYPAQLEQYEQRRTSHDTNDKDSMVPVSALGGFCLNKRHPFKEYPSKSHSHRTWLEAHKVGFTDSAVVRKTVLIFLANIQRSARESNCHPVCSPSTPRKRWLSVNPNTNSVPLKYTWPLSSQSHTGALHTHSLYTYNTYTYTYTYTVPAAILR